MASAFGDTIRNGCRWRGSTSLGSMALPPGAAPTISVSGSASSLSGADKVSEEERHLMQQIKQLEEECLFLQEENDLFEAFYTRQFPSGMSANAADEDDDSELVGVAGSSQPNSRSRGARRAANSRKGSSQQRGRRTGGSAHDDQEAPVTLTAEQKQDIASREIDELKNKKTKDRTAAERLVEQKKAEMEEAETEIAETKKDMYEFRRDVLGAAHERTGQIPGERMIKYFEDKFKARDAQIEKLRLKNTTTVSLNKKLSSQLQQREEMGEVLNVIDFDQLEIENDQYIERIDEKNEELLKLKVTAGKSVQILNNLKTRLQELTNATTSARSEITSKQKQLEQIKDELDTVMTEKEHAVRTNRRLNTLQEDVKVPEIFDYVTQKAVMYDLDKEERNWQRKVEIAEKSVKSLKAKLIAVDKQRQLMAAAKGYRPYAAQ